MMGDPRRRNRDEQWFVELYNSAYSDVPRYARRRVDEDAARDERLRRRFSWLGVVWMSFLANRCRGCMASRGASLRTRFVAHGVRFGRRAGGEDAIGVARDAAAGAFA